MRYIRTKEGKIFENHDNLQIINNALCYMQNGKVWLILGEVLKQADTIEELCDEFLLIDEKYKHDFFIDHYYDEIIDIYNDEKERVYRQRKLFGAIWTDKGLIYVAKMNSKGELELL